VLLLYTLWQLVFSLKEELWTKASVFGFLVLYALCLCLSSTLLSILFFFFPFPSSFTKPRYHLFNPSLLVRLIEVAIGIRNYRGWISMAGNAFIYWFGYILAYFSAISLLYGWFHSSLCCPCYLWFPPLSKPRLHLSFLRILVVREDFSKKISRKTVFFSVFSLILSAFFFFGMCFLAFLSDSNIGLQSFSLLFLSFIVFLKQFTKMKYIYSSFFLYLWCLFCHGPDYHLCHPLSFHNNWN